MKKEKNMPAFQTSERWIHNSVLFSRNIVGTTGLNLSQLLEIKKHKGFQTTFQNLICSDVSTP